MPNFTSETYVNPLFYPRNDTMLGMQAIDTTPWRLILSKPENGALNMAIDEVLLESVSDGSQPPVLRLYAWSPACLSLGYGQYYADVNEEALQKCGWDVVRRPTGGRAILHVDELTYSLCAASDHPLMQAGILPSYKEISLALLHALEVLAVPATHEEHYDLPAGTDPKGPVCFEVPSNWEITFEGKKLIGSAQVRRSGGVLQHGTLPLHGDLTRITEALTFPDQESRTTAATRLLERATTIETAIGRRVSWADTAVALENGLAEAFGIRFENSPLTPEESNRAAQLVEEKYANDDWTRRR